MRNVRQQGFTLIEMSIVLVIIGLIVGGVLVGQNLIKAAAARAQISQIERYQTAVSTFYGKYGYLPGDIPPSPAAQFGFVTRAGTVGRGDGNGELDGFSGAVGYSWGINGENLFLWEDLSTAGLIDGTFNTYVDGTAPSCTSVTCGLYFPVAKLGEGNVVYTYSGYAQASHGTTGFGPNFFAINVGMLGGCANISTLCGGNSLPGITSLQAFSMDMKIDDGLPTKGKVLAQYLTNSNGGQPSWSANGAATTSATCYDTSTGKPAYSITAGNNVNCGLSFQMQAGD